MKRLVLLATVGALTATGCATKEYVHEYVQAQMNPIKAQVGNADKRGEQHAAALTTLGASQAEMKSTLAHHGERIGKNETDIAQLSKTTREALERATAAGKLATGKLVYEVALTDDTLRFRSDSVSLSKEAMAALDQFATQLKQENKGVFIEIQGHTDSRGEAGANLKLGEIRAQAVLRHLNMKGGIPLHRMSAISYGEGQPVASNMNRAGRGQNRRVVLVVLQ